jgi:predicted Co/Zn/Cd cation transporter (cation efflux family)
MADDTNDLDEVWPRWKEAVNMTPSQLEAWLETEESRSVGQKESGSDESVGHRSGRRIIEILNTKRDDLADDDVEHMHKVVGYVHRHLAQEPSKEDIESSKWRYSLMNWGHDPLK